MSSSRRSDPSAVDLETLRRFTIARSFLAPTTLAKAVDRLGFVQADPIRAPARAQDLTLRHRAASYRAGDLERAYASLPIEEDFFINYGFLPRRHLALMHPRTAGVNWDATTKRRAARVLEFVRERGEVHPRDVDAEFGLGQVVNYWGGKSSATTRLLDAMHYRGFLRVVRRAAGIRVYACQNFEAAERSPEEVADALLDLAVAKYAPLPLPNLRTLATRLRPAAPQLAGEFKRAAVRARERLARATVDGVDWYWPAREDVRKTIDTYEALERVRFLAPFDPVVWDRRRFETFWGWAYRFEAYTPVKQRKLGYYALPLLWRDEVIGWSNVTAKGGAVDVAFGYVSGRAPRERVFVRELEGEVERMRGFLRGDAAE